jgi:toxin ParE1/3/4
MAMRRHIYYSPRARDDLVEIATRIARDSKSSAIRFIDAVEMTCKTLLRSPQLGLRGEFRSPHLANIQRWRVKGFENYLIFYRTVADGIFVVRLLHGARDVDAIVDDQP